MLLEKQQLKRNILRLKELQPFWDSGDYARVISLLPPLKDLKAPALLMEGILLYAKTYWNFSFSPSGNSSPAPAPVTASAPAPAPVPLDLLEKTISFGLTAACYFQNLGTPGGRTLMSTLEDQVKKVELGLPLPLAQKLARYFKTEREALEALIGSVQKSGRPSSLASDLLLAPGVVEVAELSSFLFPLLLKELSFSETFSEEEKGLEWLGLYSSVGPAMRALLQGDVEKAFRMAFRGAQATPFCPGRGERVLEYCKNRILFETALERVLQGDLSGKKYFLNLVPFLKQYPAYVTRLVQVAKDPQRVSSQYSILAEVMEALCAKIHVQEFRKAAAYCISMKVQYLREEGRIPPEKAKKLLEAAFRLDPECQAAEVAEEFMEFDSDMSQIAKALGKSQFANAVNCVEDSNDPDVEREFYSIVAELLNEMDSVARQTPESSGFILLQLKALEKELERLNVPDELSTGISRLLLELKERTSRGSGSSKSMRFA